MPSRTTLSWFQLPRIAKPSGTHGPSGRQAKGVSVVSTSPDSKAIRNRSRQTSQSSSSFEFQLPRIAKPSGTGHGCSQAHGGRHHVSTSPDSKAIRNYRPGRCRSSSSSVSTSPDSKAIRNTPRQALARLIELDVSTSPDSKAIRNVPCLTERELFDVFQLPRIAKPSGTGAVKISSDESALLVSTSPDSKAIRNLRP